VNNYIHPKRLKLFFEQIYLVYPTLKTEKNFHFYYLYTDYEEESEYIFAVFYNQYSWDKEATKFNEYLKVFSHMFGFTDCSILSSYDFDRIENEVKKIQDKIRGTQHSILFCEVW
jgi:hypothetical protein